MAEEEKVEGETTENTTEEATEETKEVEETPAEPETTEETKEAETEAEEEDQESNLEAKNRQLFERAKKAEEKSKAQEKELARLKKGKSTGEPDLDYMLEVQSATKGLDSEEVDELRLRSKAKDISLLEARKDENFVLWQNARKEKVAKAKALNPSTKQAEVKKAQSLEERLTKVKTLEEQEKILNEVGLNPMNPRGYIDNWKEGMG